MQTLRFWKVCINFTTKHWKNKKQKPKDIKCITAELLELLPLAKVFLTWFKFDADCDYGWYIYIYIYNGWGHYGVCEWKKCVM